MNSRSEDVQRFRDGGLNGGIDAWLRAIDMVRALQPAAVVAGHKDPSRTDDPRILDETAEYLYAARQVIAKRLRLASSATR
jgi:hypothetical protein